MEFYFRRKLIPPPFTNGTRRDIGCSSGEINGENAREKKEEDARFTVREFSNRRW